jgi:hypothetical protein
MTALKLLNYCILQWVGVRLGRILDEKTKKQIGWKWLTNIRPLSGWKTDYKKWFNE